MILNKVHFKEALLARLEECSKLAENPQTLGYIPEILLRTLRDSFRLVAEDSPSAGAIELCERLSLSISPALREEILALEDGLRTPQKYSELKPSPHLLLEFMQIIKKTLLS